MKKNILLLVLMTISAIGKTLAQKKNDKNGQKTKNKTEQTFNIKTSLINLRDFVDLKEGKMILELSDLSDYESIRNLDSILRNFSKDISFYKDSLKADPTAGVRIDYVVMTEYPFKKIRFKKYPSDGNIYLNQGGDISRMKFEQDTINIIMQKSKPGIGKSKCMIPYAIRASFVLGNYYDIDKIIEGNTLRKIIDTMEKTSQIKKVINNVYAHPLTIYYSPYYNSKYALTKVNWITDDYERPYVYRKKNALSIDLSIGVGLVRNIATTNTEIGMQYTKYTKWNRKNYDFFRVFSSQYFFFEKNTAGDWLVKDNWFINAEAGSLYDGNEIDWLGKKVAFGVGYLVVNKGGYFKNNTFKIFTDLQLTNMISVAPELIINDNFKQVFSGITLRFGN